MNVHSHLAWRYRKPLHYLRTIIVGIFFVAMMTVLGGAAALILAALFGQVQP